MSNYKKAKNSLKNTSEMAKSQFPKDKPMIRQIINDSVYFLGGDYKLNTYQKSLLSDYACKLHP